MNRFGKSSNPKCFIDPRFIGAIFSPLPGITFPTGMTGPVGTIQTTNVITNTSK
ncbi:MULTISPECIES: exosporium leader peptide-containing protein [Bacillus]|uniref:exosporium leader peptide-containing protein n=1 Tax=Bacillus TaxID=1386 RepID=UPI0012988B56|nr:MULTISPECIES: exosporium leader peptide-containing protein [Bacillus]MCU7390804.1 hypothetical protein [Bacillus sp. ST24]EKS7845819.1 hypothetical protein [Bacillus cereus]EKS8359277.1 hypothetical protein [Bacillus cereus]MCC2361825.1 hypothetical protein [Bacillus cereus]MCU5148677.1 hypothetical protein [Bacillus cereus]